MFYERLKNICDNKKIKITVMLKKLNIGVSNATKWKGGAIPNGETLIKISEYLNVSIDYLLLGKENKEKEEIDELTEEIIKIFKKMKTQGKIQVIQEAYHQEELEAQRREEKLG